MYSAAKLAFLLLGLASLPTPGSAQESYWAAAYPRFGGGKSPAGLEVLSRRFFEHTTLHNLSIHAKTLPEALEEVRTALREAHAEFGLGYTLSQSDYSGYSKPYHLLARQMTLATVVDRLAEQGRLQWGFNASGSLTFFPAKSL